VLAPKRLVEQLEPGHIFAKKDLHVQGSPCAAPNYRFHLLSGALSASFRSVAGGPSHLVLVDRCGQAWSWGRGPQSGRVDAATMKARKKEEEEDKDDDDVVLTRMDFFQVGIALVVVGEFCDI
jgi:alpha-tubulin suppressor-like RCC1 family protein